MDNKQTPEAAKLAAVPTVDKAATLAAASIKAEAPKEQAMIPPAPKR